MIEELDRVKLKDKSKYKAIDVSENSVGTVVDVVGGGEAYTVEFLDEEGYTYEKPIWPYYQAEDLELVGSIGVGILTNKKKLVPLQSEGGTSFFLCLCAKYAPDSNSWSISQNKESPEISTVSGLLMSNLYTKDAAKPNHDPEERA